MLCGMKILFLLIAFGYAAQVHAQETPLMRSAMIAYAATAVVDNIQTHVVLKRGGVEANPLLAKLGGQHPLRTVAINGAVDSLTLYGWKRVHDAGHPKLAIAALLASTAFRGWVDYHNVKTLQVMR